MKVLQLIDSLHAGGAERVAVNMANSLTSRLEASFLCATREEGLLKESLFKEVGYLFLNKKSILDFTAISKLNHFIKTNKIDVIHAHSTSFFLGTLMKIWNPKLILIWHDHYGKSEFLKERPKLILKWCSKYFNHIFCVNKRLLDWAKDELKHKSFMLLPNFVVCNYEKPKTELKGFNSMRIVCLANLRPQKDHMNLLQAFKSIHAQHSDWSLHLVGHDFKDTYSMAIKEFIRESQLENDVFLYGSCSDTNHILTQSTIGVLSSKSEGLPLALLEYGLAGLPVVVTDVGDCNLVISNSSEGLIVPSENPKALTKAIERYINNPKKRIEAGKKLELKVKNSFSESTIIRATLEIYSKHQT